MALPPHERAIAFQYGCLSLFHVLLHNIYLLYHVSIFIKFFKITTTWFWIAELIFVVWNSLNDTIFGIYVDSDEILGTEDNKKNNLNCAIKRIKSLAFHGPLFCLSFVGFWYNWIPAYPGVQLVLCLCTYDAFLTMLDLNQHALLSELSESLYHRVAMAKYTSLFSVLGTLPLFYVQRTWANEMTNNQGNELAHSPWAFTQICTYLGILCSLGYYSTTKKLYNLVQEKYQILPTKKRNSDPNLKPLKWYQPLENKPSVNSGYEKPQPISRTNPYSVLQRSRKVTVYIAQLWRRSNFRIYAAVNLIQTLHCHFNSNFFPLFLGVLFHENSDKSSPDSDSDQQSAVIPTSWLLVISFILPHMLNLYNLKLVERFGAYQVITIMFMFKVLAGVILFFATVNRDDPESLDTMVLVCLLIGYIIFNRVLTEGVCKLLSLPLADLCDEDRMLRGRNAAAALSGTISLFGKPGQSLAPLIGHFLLHDNQSKENVVKVMYLVPITLGVLQCLLWSQFNLTKTRDRRFL